MQMVEEEYGPSAAYLHRPTLRAVAAMFSHRPPLCGPGHVSESRLCFMALAVQNLLDHVSCGWLLTGRVLRTAHATTALIRDQAKSCLRYFSLEGRAND